MAEETVDRAIIECGLKAERECVTKGLLLDGAHCYTPTLFIRLIQDFGLDHQVYTFFHSLCMHYVSSQQGNLCGCLQVAEHLASTYGDRAFKVAKLARLTGKRWPVVGKRLHEEYPYIEAEILWALREYACTSVDVIARRTRLAFVNVHAAEEALPRIIEIMAKECDWSPERQKVHSFSDLGAAFIFPVED